MRAEKEPRVIGWLDKQPHEQLHITAMTLFEVLNGIEEMPTGARRMQVMTSLAAALAGPLNNRIVEIDEAAVRSASYLYGQRRRGGKIVAMADTLIAGAALSRGATLATGNLRHFSDLPIPVVNPWKGP